MSETDVTGARPGAVLQAAAHDARSDAVLIAAVRAGDTDAYGELFARHVDAARRLARSLSRDGEADDLVSEAFAKVLVVLQRGQGPDVALRPYLLTALRRLHIDRVRAVSRTRPTDDLAAYDSGEAFQDTAVAAFESGAAARAFASLPERWQLVLWHLEVEGQKPADIAPLLGISSNSVSALAYRAREGLRQAFVSMHAQEADDERCTTTRAQLGAFIRDDISKRDGAAVEAHLRDCRECAGIYLELREVNSDLRALIAPLILGGAATTYLGTAGAVGGAGAVGSLFTGLFTGLITGVSSFLGKAGGRSLAGATVAGVVVVGVLAGIHAGGDDQRGAPTSDPATTPSAGPAADPARGRKPGSRRQPAAVGPSSPSGPDGVDQSEAGLHPSTDPGGRPDEPDQTSPHQPDQPDGPEDPNEPPTTDPIGVDGSVSSSARSTGGVVWQVRLGVAGLTTGQRGLLTVTLDRPAAVVHLDPRCDLVGPGRLTCRLHGPGVVDLVVTPAPGAPTRLTAVLTTPGAPDPHPADNRTTVRLG